MSDKPNYEHLDENVKAIVSLRKKLVKMQKNTKKKKGKVDPYEANLEIQQTKNMINDMLIAVKPKIVKG